ILVHVAVFARGDFLVFRHLASRNIKAVPASIKAKELAMRPFFRSFSLSFVLATLLLCTAVAQAPSSGPATIDPRAGAVLQAAIEALGGTERLSKLDQWFVEGKGRENLSGELQGLSPDAPTWRAHEERVAVSRASGSVAWERRSPRNDFSLRWRRFIY